MALERGGINITAHNLALTIDSVGKGGVSAGEVDRGEARPILHKPVVMKDGGISVFSDDLAAVVDPEGYREICAGDVERYVPRRVLHKSVPVELRGFVAAHDLAAAVNSVGFGITRVGKVDRGEGHRLGGSRRHGRQTQHDEGDAHCQVEHAHWPIHRETPTRRILAPNRKFEPSGSSTSTANAAPATSVKMADASRRISSPNALACIERLPKDHCRRDSQVSS